MKLAGDYLPVSSSRKAGLGSSLHFVSLRMTDICVFEEEVVGGYAANHLFLHYNFINTCHSERSDESYTNNEF